MDTSVTQNLSGVRKQIEDAIDKRIEQRRPLSPSLRFTHIFGGGLAECRVHGDVKQFLAD
jgi:hypothetical protein